MQKLSRVASKAENLKFGSTIHLEKQPELAMLAMKIISGAVTIETSFARIFVALLESQAAAGSAIYFSLLTDRAKNSATKAAAEQVIAGDDLRIFRAVDKIADSALAWRHKMAHWIWGATPDIPDGLLILDPKYFAPVNVMMMVKWGKELPPDATKIDRENVFVVRKSDLERGLKEVVLAQRLALDLESLLYLLKRDPLACARLRAQLLAEPRIKASGSGPSGGSK